MDNGFDYDALQRLVRQRLEAPRPDKVDGPTDKMHTPFGQGFLTFSTEEAPDGTKRPYEMFVRIGKGGEDINAAMEGLGRVLSAAIRSGVPVTYLIEQMRGISGKTQVGSKTGMVRSLPDALAATLENMIEKYGPKRFGLEGDKAGSNGKAKVKVGNLCPKCSGQLRGSEGCEVCDTCGFSRC